jgi:hypothetical protein
MARSTDPVGEAQVMSPLRTPHAMPHRGPVSPTLIPESWEPNPGSISQTLCLLVSLLLDHLRCSPVCFSPEWVPQRGAISMHVNVATFMSHMRCRPHGCRWVLSPCDLGKNTPLPPQDPWDDGRGQLAHRPGNAILLSGSIYWLQWEVLTRWPLANGRCGIKTVLSLQSTYWKVT